MTHAGTRRLVFVARSSRLFRALLFLRFAMMIFSFDSAAGDRDLAPFGLDALQQRAKHRVVHRPTKASSGSELHDLLLDGLGHVRFGEPQPAESLPRLGGEHAPQDLLAFGLAPVHLLSLRGGVRILRPARGGGLGLLELADAALPQLLQFRILCRCHRLLAICVYRYFASSGCLSASSLSVDRDTAERIFMPWGVS